MATRPRVHKYAAAAFSLIVLAAGCSSAAGDTHRTNVSIDTGAISDGPSPLPTATAEPPLEPCDADPVHGDWCLLEIGQSRTIVAPGFRLTVLPPDGGTVGIPIPLGPRDELVATTIRLSDPTERTAAYQLEVPRAAGTGEDVAIVGRVVASGTGLPVSGAAVRFAGKVTETDDDGRFRLVGAAGDDLIVVAADGFIGRLDSMRAVRESADGQLSIELARVGELHKSYRQGQHEIELYPGVRVVFGDGDGASESGELALTVAPALGSAISIGAPMFQLSPLELPDGAQIRITLDGDHPDITDAELSRFVVWDSDRLQTRGANARYDADTDEVVLPASAAQTAQDTILFELRDVIRVVERANRPTLDPRIVATAVPSAIRKCGEPPDLYVIRHDFRWQPVKRIEVGSLGAVAVTLGGVQLNPANFVERFTGYTDPQSLSIETVVPAGQVIVDPHVKVSLEERRVDVIALGVVVYIPISPVVVAAGAAAGESRLFSVIYERMTNAEFVGETLQDPPRFEPWDSSHCPKPNDKPIHVRTIEGDWTIEDNDPADHLAPDFDLDPLHEDHVENISIRRLTHEGRTLLLTARQDGAGQSGCHSMWQIWLSRQNGSSSTGGYTIFNDASVVRSGTQCSQGPAIECTGNGDYLALAGPEISPGYESRFWLLLRDGRLYSRARGNCGLWEESFWTRVE